MAKQNDVKTFAFVTTFFSIIGFIIALLFWRDEKYVMFYAKQSLIVFILAIVASLVGGILELIPILGSIIIFGLNSIVFIFWIYSWINALSGKMKEVPVVGHYGKKIKL